MSEYEKLEWLHSQISELKDGVMVDLDTMQSFIEDLREKHLELPSENLLWIGFKGKQIRVEQDPEFNDGKLMITVHKPNEDYHAKLLVEEKSDEV